MDEMRDRNEPQEVVDWYVPRQGTEVVDCYVHHRPLPESVRPAPPKPPRKRTGLWIFLGIMGLLAVVLVLAAVFGQSSQPEKTEPDDDDASSIIDIFSDRTTTIPRDTNYDPSRKLVISAGHGEELTAQEVYAKVNPATVLVVAEQGESASVGTGVIMSADGYVITNAHVISGGAACWVMLANGMDYDAKLVGYDADEDIAVLKLVEAQDLPVAEFGDSELAVVGDPVYAIGNPLGIELRGTLTEGIISAINRNVELDGRTLTVLQTTAALNNGNSGGPLINRYGQVIGINTLKMSGTGAPDEATVEGLGFALPISSACLVINDIIANGEFHGLPMLGIMVDTVETSDGTTAVLIQSVESGYGAEEAGVQPGDLILAADGQTVYSTADLLEVRRSHVIGDSMTLTLLRDGQVFDVTIVLRSSKR